MADPRRPRGDAPAAGDVKRDDDDDDGDAPLQPVIKPPMNWSLGVAGNTPATPAAVAATTTPYWRSSLSFNERLRNIVSM
jgi:hypothetical protein